MSVILERIDTKAEQKQMQAFADNRGKWCEENTGFLLKAMLRLEQSPVFEAQVIRAVRIGKAPANFAERNESFSMTVDASAVNGDEQKNPAEVYEAACMMMVKAVASPTISGYLKDRVIAREGGWWFLLKIVGYCTDDCTRILKSPLTLPAGTHVTRAIELEIWLT